jgi:hypothetical protein
MIDDRIPENVRTIVINKTLYVYLYDMALALTHAQGRRVTQYDLALAYMIFVGLSDNKNYIPLVEKNMPEYKRGYGKVLLITLDGFKEARDFLLEMSEQQWIDIKSAVQMLIPEYQDRPEPPKPPTAKHLGYVYVIGQVGRPEYYKIGKTRNLGKRLSQLQVGSPVKLCIIHSVECSNYSYLEGLLHGRYASKRESGEWFHLTDDELDELKSLTVREGRVTIKRQHKRLSSGDDQ